MVLRILKLANSAAYGMTRHMSNISKAIALLGYKNVSNIVLERFAPLLPVLAGRQSAADFERWLYTEAAKTLLPENTYAALFWLDYRKTHPRDIYDTLAETGLRDRKSVV